MSRTKALFLMPLTLLLALVSILLSAFALPSTASLRTRPLTGSAASWTRHAQQTDRHSPQDQLTVGMVLKTSHPEQQQQLLKDLYNPKSSSYHKWISSSQFSVQFPPAASDVAAAKKYLTGQGLKLTTSPDATFVMATGSTGQVEQAFHTRINNYRLASGEVQYGNSSDAQLPANLSKTTLGVFGLSNYRPLVSRAVKPHAGKADAPYGGGPLGSGLTPSQLAGIYNATPVYTKLKNKGQGATMALYELSGYKHSDVTAYEKQYKLPNVKLEDRNVLGGPKDHDGAGEVLLDIEVQAGLAPGAKKIIVYNAPSTEIGILAEYYQMAKDNEADVISTSWGAPCEYSLNSQIGLAENQIFLQMAAQGQSLFSASGDAGAYGCAAGDVTNQPANQALQIGEPNNEPYITSVGGTSFRKQFHGTILFDPGKNQNPSYPGTSKETIWNGGCDSNQVGCKTFGGSAGGVSRIWAEPDYAFDATSKPLPGVVDDKYSQSGAYCGQQPGVVCRENPDISLVADPDTGYSVYCTDPGDTFCKTGEFGKPGWVRFGGTSASSPAWSAFAALDITQHKGRLGLYNYKLYPFDSASGYKNQLHDITIGDNGYYPATPNYDQASGLGTPNVYNIITSK